MRRTSSFSSLALPLAALLALAGCDDATGADAGIDAGASGDAGRDSGPPRPDSGSRDSGPTDPCAGDEPTANVGCNGAILGASQPDDGFGGRCTPGTDTDPTGSCTGTDAFCYAFDPDGNDSPVGICIVACTPNGTNYTNTSDCPSGSRCFDFGTGDGFGACFPDCNADTDCSTSSCDAENTCVGVMPGDADAGVPDGGTMDDAGMDDAGTTDDAGLDGGIPPV